MSQSTPSNHESTNLVLQSRNILWRQLRNEEIQEQQNLNTSFDTEWKQLVKVISPHSMHLETSAWDKHFQSVLTATHESEDEFDKKLFAALKGSLLDIGATSEASTEEVSEFFLNNMYNEDRSIEGIGFCRQANRENYGFKDDYGASKNSKPDHVCFVRTRTTNNEGHVDDLTAVIELKTNQSSPKPFVTRGSVVVKKPNLQNNHSAIGQALLYTLDSWHCLARRGISVEKLPVTVLAGRVKGNGNGLLCVDACLHLPDLTGDTFTYTINGFESFPTPNEGEEAAHKKALAIYIRALRIGVEKGIEIVNSRKHPISLCCRRLKIGEREFGESEFALLASPIPKGVDINDELKITQGELFKLKLTDTLKLSNFGEAQDCVYYFASDETFLYNQLIIKVSCISVHSMLVPLDKCDKAFGQ